MTFDGQSYSDQAMPPNQQGPEILAENLLFPEGPIAMPDGSVLLVEIARQTLTRVDRDGSHQPIAYLGGGPNGAALGPGGNVFIANNGGSVWSTTADGALFPGDAPSEHIGGSIQVVDPRTGAVSTLYDSCNGRRLNAPNDLVFDSSGGFWFTDFGKTRGRQMDRGALYYALEDGSRIEEKVFPMDRPNGCALSPDGKTLYVSETPTARLWAFQLESPGVIRSAEGHYRGEHGRVIVGLGGYRMFDSLAIDSAGHICVATVIDGAISEMSPSGKILKHIPLPDRIVTNICFGGPDLTTAYVTLGTTGRLVTLVWPRPGLRLAHS